MKIVRINAVYAVASTGRTVKEAHEYLIENGHDSYVYVGSNGQYPKNVFQIGNKFGRKMHALLSRVFGLQGYYSYFSTTILIKKLKKIQPDVVHLSNLHSNYINLGILLKYLAKYDVPTVIQLHDCWFFTGRCVYYTEEKCDGFRTGCKKCIKNYNGNPSLLFDRAEKMYNDKKKWFNDISKLHVVGVSNWITDEAKKSFFDKHVKFSSIYNWIDLNKFKPGKQDKKNKRPIVLSVATSWTENKGLYDIIKIAKKIPEADFVLVGGCTKKIDGLDNVKIVGKTNNVEELVEYYQNADVFLNPSRQETFGKVTAEALACGTPVIVYNVTAMPELVGKNCGYVIPYLNIDEMSNKVKQIIEDGKIKYTYNCRKWAEDKFDKNKIMKEWMNLYKSLSV
ncbi:MAG: glycosyltransferase [Clostridia bacterium]|nr:glycosyltransferase [Clostridia bacterium]